MKPLPLRILLAGLVALAFSITTALAQDSEDKKPRGPSKADLKKYDANQDGTLDEAETAAMKADKEAQRAAKREADLEKYDENKDGKINKNEREKKKADDAAEKAAKKAEREAKKGQK